MKDEYMSLLTEIRDMLKVLSDEQGKLVKSVLELKEEQKKLHEEVKLNNFVLNHMSLKNEILN